MARGEVFGWNSQNRRIDPDTAYVAYVHTNCCSDAIGDKSMLCRPSLEMVKLPYEKKRIEVEVKQETINQSTDYHFLHAVTLVHVMDCILKELNNLNSQRLCNYYILWIKYSRNRWYLFCRNLCWKIQTTRRSTNATLDDTNCCM